MNFKQQERLAKRNAARAQYLAGQQMARIMRQTPHIRFDSDMGLGTTAFAVGFITTACALPWSTRSTSAHTACKHTHNS